MNRRQAQHFSLQVQVALQEIQNADTGKMPLSYVQNRIRFIEDKVKAVQRRNWKIADELQEALTHVCLDNGSL